MNKDTVGDQVNVYASVSTIRMIRCINNLCRINPLLLLHDYF